MYAKEEAIWMGTRDVEPLRLGRLTVDPGRFPGDTTRMHVTYYKVNRPNGELSVFERFTLHGERSDGQRH